MHQWMEIMQSRKIDWATSFCMFEDRIEEEAQPYMVVAKNAQVQAIEGSKQDALRKLTALIEGGWHPVGLFAVSLCEPGNAMGGVYTGVGTPALHIERDFVEWPPSSEDAELFAEALSEAVRGLSREEAQW
jgi:hypothetical protein